MVEDKKVPGQPSAAMLWMVIPPYQAALEENEADAHLSHYLKTSDGFIAPFAVLGVLPGFS